MFPLSPTLWIYLGVAILIAGLGIAVKVQTSRLDAVTTEYAEFKAGVRAKGEAAEAARVKDIADRKAITTRQEAASAKRYAGLDQKYRAALDAARGLPSADPGSRPAEPLSSAAAVIGCPDRSADLNRGLEQLEVGILALLDRGNRAIERSIACEAWITEQVNR